MLVKAAYQEYDVRVSRDGTVVAGSQVTETVYIDSTSYTPTPQLQLFLTYNESVPATNRTPS